MEDFIYSGEFGYKEIKLYIRDHNNPTILDCFQNDDEWLQVF
jgi:hypothetical protein